MASEGQVQDTGSKAIHLAPDTVSIIRSKSISKGGGVSNYRGQVKIGKRATNAESTVMCDALILDDKSVSNTYPSIKNEGSKVSLSHEARVGKIGDDEIFYLRSRGYSEADALRREEAGQRAALAEQQRAQVADADHADADRLARAGGDGDGQLGGGIWQDVGANQLGAATSSQNS